MSDSKKMSRHYLDEGNKAKKKSHVNRLRRPSDDEDDKFNWNEMAKKINLEDENKDEDIYDFQN